MQEGRLSDLIAMWKPWWYLPHDAPVITPLETKTNNATDEEDDNASSDEEEQELAPPPSQVPLVLDDVKPLSALTSAPPSPLVMYNIIEALYAYAYTARIFNGEFHEAGIEAVDLILNLSSVLSENKIYQNGTEALHKSLENSLKPHVKNTRGFSISVLEDVNEMFKSKKFILAALSDLYRLFDTETKMAPASKSKKPSKVMLAAKKIYFFICWANEDDEQSFGLVRLEIFTEWQKQLEYLKELENTKKPSAPKPPSTQESNQPLTPLQTDANPRPIVDSAQIKKKVLIEELN
jgi:hypothetical protein